jgi:hypothetical protein
MHDEMAKADSVADPIEAHIHGLGASLLGSVIDNSLSLAHALSVWTGVAS